MEQDTVITERNYAAALEWARIQSRKTYTKANHISGWENPDNEQYWEVREAIPAAVRARGLRFGRVIGYPGSINYWDDVALWELAAPVWGEVGGSLLISSVHDT